MQLWKRFFSGVLADALTKTHEEGRTSAFSQCIFMLALKAQAAPHAVSNLLNVSACAPG
jgi:hypothetical protein